MLPALAADDFTPQSGTDPPTELDPWLAAYEFEHAVDVPGANAPVRYTDDGLGITSTGKAEAAATTAALLSSPALDLSEAVVASVGVAGAPPEACTLGSVVVSDALVDWDRKFRWAERDGAVDRAVDLLAYRPHDYVHRLDAVLVAEAVEAARDATLVDAADVRAVRERYDADAARASPAVEVGTQVCGDEFWHGPTCSRWAAWLADAYDAGPYVATAMEDYGTATALDRVGRLDRYVSVRGVANFDRPSPGQSVAESLRGDAVEHDSTSPRSQTAHEDAGAFALGSAVENAFRAGSRLVDRVVART